MRYFSRVRKGIALLVACSMMLAEIAWARDFIVDKNGNRISIFDAQFDGQAAEGIRWFRQNVSDSIPALEETNLAKLSRYDLIPTIQDLYGYYQRAMVQFRKEYEEKGHEEFMADLKNNEVKYIEPGYEEMAFTLVDGEPIARTIHKESQVSIVFAEKDKINQESKHLQQFLARQNFDSGRTRTPEEKYYFQKKGAKLKKRKVRTGRDTIFIHVDREKGIEGSDIKPMPRPKILSKEWKTWFKRWWAASWKKPDKYNVLTGVTFGLIQTATGYLVSGLVIGSNPTPEAMEMIHVAGGLNFLFGTTIGTFASFYHNVRRRGEVWWQTVKSSMVSVAFAISLKLLGPDGFATLNIFDPSLGVLPWIQIANMVQNFAANNMLKTAWYQWADLRSEARVDRDNYVVKIPYGVRFKRVKKDRATNKVIEVIDENADYDNLVLDQASEGSDHYEDIQMEFIKTHWETPITTSDVNRQFWSYMPVNTFRLIDLLVTSIFVTSVSQDWTVPIITTMMLWAMVPASFWINHKMALRDFKDKPEVIEAVGTEKAWVNMRRRFISDEKLQTVSESIRNAKAFSDDMMNRLTYSALTWVAQYGGGPQWKSCEALISEEVAAKDL